MFRSTCLVTISFWSLLQVAHAAQEPAGAVFHITPGRPVPELMDNALKATPPAPSAQEKKPDLVDLSSLSPLFHFDVRYATTRNFLSYPVYSSSHAYLERPAAQALVRVQRALHSQGYGLLIYDAYRPWYVTKLFWDATPPDKHQFVADPAVGSMHNRGCAVDLTLYELKSGLPVSMPSGFDEMTPRAYADYTGGTQQERKSREILRQAMAREGFTQLPEEWWHFDYKDWRDYPVQNLRFEDIPPVVKRTAAP
ncbi:M15 family metallopeptidase [Novacetimonas hansenii]|uniref:M15 family metallopeptidase n=1 Tax=Novacetimonas hansenii TaxID=436 RepID=UPI000789AB7B|nr:M15 family metallopeptidase [Novacetimonas hansenii]PYD74168.1 D-alanyl-D-alanine dipeptidase [Novacetimonas hansenii]RFP01194.1 D-alanyl-D-alanine dipeptidase [Novacetimonas hansenii]WEQ59515.1 M15 family metallopeptidase [Novacetimonas hansenii]CUW46842.1 D-alanyl-D-alanine dipeptidase [Novacetimonas hansenii]